VSHLPKVSHEALLHIINSDAQSGTIDQSFLHKIHTLKAVSQEQALLLQTEWMKGFNESMKRENIRAINYLTEHSGVQDLHIKLSAQQHSEQQELAKSKKLIQANADRVKYLKSLQSAEICVTEKDQLIQCYKNSSSPLQCADQVQVFQKCSMNSR
jgi:hypothetical protein